MEITLDVGKNIASEIEKLAVNEKTDFEIVALKILDLGLRVYQSSNDDKSDELVNEPMLVDIFKNSLETKFLLKEIIGHVFIKERSTIKAYDHLSAINVSENMAKSFMQGKEII